jgi:hypothetical protein
MSTLRVLCSLFILFAAGGAAVAAAAGAPPKTLDFVVVSLNTAVYETQYMDECPEGLALSNDELWWISTPPAVRARITDNGALEPEKWRAFSAVRGPHGEDVCWNPTLVKDPPLRTVRGRSSFGMNLDGTDDGHPTPKSCAHEKFTGVDGRKGVDNQLYRIVGCTFGWRKSGYIDRGANAERLDSSQGVILIEITGVDDWHTEGDVQVAFYRAVDALPKDSAGNILPYASYRIDDPARYGTITKGRIKDGVLTTEPVDARLPFYGNASYMEIYLRGLRLELHAAPDGRGAEGLLAGYQDLDNWYDYIRKMDYLTTTGQFSCPAFYEAGKRLADGYPDPNTGECTALSAAFHIEGLPAFVIHSDFRPGVRADAQTSAPAGDARAAAPVAPAAARAAAANAGKRFFHADLSAEGETAVVQSNARGTAEMVLDLSDLKLTWKIVYRNLNSEPLRVGLHGPAQAGSNGVVQVNLAPRNLSSPVAGSAILNEALVQYMLSGWTYVDIPTRKYPRGEIRGRLAVRPPALK